MRRLNGSVLVAGISATLLLTGCGQTTPTIAAPTPPSATATGTTPATTAPTVSPTTAPTPSDPASPTASPSVTATPTPTPSPTKAKGLVLSGSGVGGHKFGTAEAKVEKTLESALGEPDESVQGILCELDSGSPWQRSVIYEGFAVVFTAKSAKKSAPRTLNSWSLSLDGTLPKVQLEDDIPLNLSFKQLKAKYPKGKLADTGLGDGSEIFTLPNGIRFVGVEVPDMVMAGELHYCE
jgi:hypothetical protein